MKILFLKHPMENRDPWAQDVLDAIGTRHNVITFDESAPVGPQFRDIDVVIDQGGCHSTREMADYCGSLKLWQILGTGFEKLDVKHWERKGIPVSNTPGQFSSVALAECALMFMIMLARRWHETQRRLRKGIFYNTFGAELLGKRLLLIGFGSSARELALRAKPFGVRILAIDIAPISEEVQVEFGLDEAGKPADLDRMLTDCDFASLHLHLNEETRELIDRRRLALLKPEAFLINVARGALVDEEALSDALAAGRLAGAGLDVFADEPGSPDHPLLAFPNVVATPHISGSTYGTSKRRAECVAENIDRVARGLEPLYLVNRPVSQSVLTYRS